MQILSMDIGGGTKNILLYDSRRSLENSVKLVLPTPSLIHADRVRSTTRIGKDIFIRGDTIGGGGFTEAVREHIASGHRVLMTSQAAYSIRNDLDEVRKMGIEIATEAPKGFRGERPLLGIPLALRWLSRCPSSSPRPSRSVWSKQLGMS